jgi:hypothetical protein
MTTSFSWDTSNQERAMSEQSNPEGRLLSVVEAQMVEQTKSPAFDELSREALQALATLCANDDETKH